MSEMTKQEFIELVVETIREHPVWLSSMLEATQLGVGIALEEERTKTAKLAYAFSAFIDAYPKLKPSTLASIQDGIIALKHFFTGAPIEKQIDRYVIGGEK